ncbi:MAG: hypothetical protein H0T42_02900 [Deltaproteobacteria bacterium]|nr:hypothetical protein [Deltaproteobacteria bacterium]
MSLRFALLLVLLTAGATHAQAPGTLRDDAVRKFETQDYPQAVEAFKACFQIERHPECLYGLGQAYRALGDCPRAADAYRAFMRTSPSEAARQKAELNIERCQPAQPVQPVPAPVATPPPPPTIVVTESPWYRDRTGGALAIGGIAAIAAGTTFMVLAGGARDAATVEGRGDGSLQAFDDHMTRADRHHLVGSIAFAAGGTLAIAALLRYSLRDSTTATPAVTARASRRWIAFELHF